jgi:hypothetical protein
MWVECAQVNRGDSYEGAHKEESAEGVLVFKRRWPQKRYVVTVRTNGTLAMCYLSADGVILLVPRTGTVTN